MQVPRRLSRPDSPAGTASVVSVSPPRAGTPMLEADGVSKSFGITVALDDVSVTFSTGEIHALLGENGAGKTTLTRIIAGVESPDSGEIRFAGDAIAHASPAAALSLGIGLIHQELSLIPALSVGANVFLGREPRTARGRSTTARSTAVPRKSSATSVPPVTAPTSSRACRLPSSSSSRSRASSIGSQGC